MNVVFLLVLTAMVSSPYVYGEASLWAEEAPDMTCVKENEICSSCVTKQEECQAYCIQDSSCIGIVYSHQDAANSKYCYTCRDDNLKAARNSFGFYRRPAVTTVLWPKEIDDAYCKTNYEYSRVSNQAECQDLCRAKALCVGISYSPGDCRTCEDDEVTSHQGYSFYRRPDELLAEDSIDDRECKDRELWCAYSPDCSNEDVKSACPKHCSTCQDTCVDLEDFCQYRPDCAIAQVKSQCPKLCGVCDTD